MVLGRLATRGDLSGFDLAVSHALNLQRDVSPDWLILMMQAVSWLGGGVVRWGIVLLLAAALWRLSGRAAALWLGGAALTANMASSLLKLGFERTRPSLVLHLDHVTSFSYPSGHAASVTAIALACALFAPARRRPAVLAAAIGAIFLTALSRVMLGVHWPSDVVGGTLLGFAVVMIVMGAQRWGRGAFSANSATRGP